LTHGSLVAQKPGEFGIKEVWHIEGDEFQTGLFFQEGESAKTERQRAQIESLVADISGRWSLRRYPWAGALSTAHTMLCYARFGKGAFRDVQPAPALAQLRPVLVHARYDVAAVEEQSSTIEASIWHELVQNRRKVTRTDYEALAAEAPLVLPAPGSWRCAPGEAPERVPGPAQGRRQSHAPNSAKLHGQRRVPRRRTAP
jgi:anaerobic magnesium-protoporphyrin IX monomethyl ester cyclase